MKPHISTAAAVLLPAVLGFAMACTWTQAADAGSISGIVHAGGAPLENVTVDLYAAGFFAVTTTDANGFYQFTGLLPRPAGYQLYVVIPLGYRTVDPEEAGYPFTISGEEGVQRDFALALVPDPGAARGLGYWKHQATALVTGRGAAQETPQDMDAYGWRIYQFTYPRSGHEVNIALVTSWDGIEPHSLGTIYEVLSTGNGISYWRAVHHSLALFLNVASNRLQTWNVVSADGATLSQAVQQLDAWFDAGDPATYERIKDVAETINSGGEVEAGVIDLSAPDIRYAPRPTPALVGQARPNPMVRSTTIEFDMHETGPGVVSVYDAVGRRVRTLVDGVFGAGRQQVAWDGTTESGTPVANGVYFYRVQTPGQLQTSRLVVRR